MAKKAKLPKKVGGVKVPAAVRDPGWIADIMTSPLVREAVAAALVAGAGAAAAVMTRSSGVSTRATAEHKPGASLGKELTQVAVGAMAGMASQAAKSMLTSSASKAAGKSAGANQAKPPRTTAKRNGGTRRNATT